MTRRVKILVVGQTPPPMHGQAAMIERLVGAPFEKLNIVHVRMAFSETIDEVGRFKLRKLWHFLGIVVRIAWRRMVQGVDVLYYPPAGPDRVPLVRDIAILGCTRWMFRKTIFHFHILGIAGAYQKLPAPLRWLGQFALFSPDASICVSPSATDDAKFLASRKTYVVPNGIDDPLANGQWHGAPRESARLRILFVGNLREQKGVCDLIESCAVLQSRGVPLELELLGAFHSAQFEQRLREQVSRLHLQPHVRFAGILSGTAKWQAFARSNVLCLPSHADAAPVVVLEAMSFTLPVVATRCGAIPQMVDHEITGTLIEIGDVPALANRLQELHAQPEGARRMGAAGRAKFLREYTAARHLGRMEEALLDAARRKPRPSAALGRAVVEGETAC